MSYLKYEDSKKLMDVIRTKHYLGRTTKQIAEEVGRDATTVSYYLRKLGVSRPRRRPDVSYCLVCRKNAVDRTLKYVCRDYTCVGVYNEVFQVCQMRDDDADHMMLVDIQPSTTVKIPDTYVICTKNDIHRVFVDAEDHLRYHVYHFRKNAGMKTYGLPVVLWTNQLELKQCKERRKEAEHLRRMQNSEIQPRRIR